MFSADSIWYVGVAAAIAGSILTHHPAAALVILGLHLCKEWMDLQHRIDHNTRIQNIENRLKQL